MSRESSSGRSTMKYAKICSLTDVHGLYCISYSPSSILHFCSLPTTFGHGYRSRLAFALPPFPSLELHLQPLVRLQATDSAVHWKSLSFVHFFKVLKNENDFSADLERNLFRLASFLFNFCTSFRHFGDFRFKTTPTLSGHTIIPSVFTLYPRNVPSSIPKTGEHPSHTFSLCSDMCRGTPVISAGFQANTSRLRLSPETIVHSSGIILLLWRVSIPPKTGNFSIPSIFLISHMISLLKPMRGAVAGIIWLFTFGQSLLKQCSYSIYDADPPSTYIRCTKCPPISTPMIISLPSHLHLLRMGTKFLDMGRNFAFDELGVGNSVHESVDSPAF
nr:hypothetical protein [Tanacetum cinerariifolium]